MSDNQSVLKITQDTFDDSVLASPTPVLVDFWAAWCAPCRALAPIVDELAESFDGRVAVGKVDVDANPELTERYGISSIPTLILFQGGEIVERVTGIASRRTLAEKLEAVAA